MIGIYNKKIDFNNITYSIDMLRVKGYINYNTYNELDFYLRTYYKENIKKFYISDRIQSFKYNWNIEIEEGKSFYIGFCHNTEEKLAERFNPEYNLTIEFNPNKLRGHPLIMHILSLTYKWYLRRYDLAIDIKVNILDLIIDKTAKRKYKIFGGSGDDKTYIFGTSGDKMIKIYNKKRESDLHITGDLTRIEITREVDDFFLADLVMWNYDNFFPDIYLNQYVYSLSDFEEVKESEKTTRALLFAVQSGYPLRDLTRTYREKVKKILQGGYKIKFDNKTANQVLRQTILYYFLGKVVFK